MQTSTRQSQHHIAGPDVPPVDDVVVFHDADAEAGHVVIARSVEVRQDGRLAAHQRTICVMQPSLMPLMRSRVRTGSSFGMAM